MTPLKFWKTTPAQLSLLSSVHAEINNPTATKKVAKTVEEAGIEI